MHKPEVARRTEQDTPISSCTAPVRVGTRYPRSGNPETRMDEDTFVFGEHGFSNKPEAFAKEALAMKGWWLGGGFCILGVCLLVGIHRTVTSDHR